MDDFAGFYLASKDAVFRAVLAAGGRRADAEDAVAEAYARAFNRWPVVQAHPNPKAWVLRTAFNWQRTWWRRTRQELLGHSADRPSATESVDTHLRQMVRALPRRQREVVALRLLADLSAEQTAEILGIAVGTVHVHLHRAVIAMRDLVAQKEALS